MDHIDGALWDKMQELTAESVQAAIGTWVGKGEIKALIQRRDIMKADFDKRIAADPSFVTR